jgi:hypothetical protein
MRPGSAVRLKGTWYNAAEKKQPGTEGSFVSDTQFQRSQSASDMVRTQQDAESTLATQELQVNEVEILGASDPQASRSRLALIMT